MSSGSTFHRYFATATSSTVDDDDAPVSKRRPRRKKAKYEQFSEAKLSTGLMTTTTTGLEDPFQYSGDSIEDYKEKANLSPWVPIPDSVARKIFDRAVPEHDDGSQISKTDEVSVPFFSSVTTIS